MAGRQVVQGYDVGDVVVFAAGTLELYGRVVQLGREVLYVALEAGTECVVLPSRVRRRG